ncbi:MAG: acyl carrier protein [Candidatus Omnitrophica bacterium]|nr:hypothetical protein [bacterium]NUN96625.1 acyl carrier protein [Candidatus Omnitrophota bacterium]
MDELRAQLQEVFREVFDDEEIALRDEMTGNDIEGWDSLMHLNLIIAVESRFGVKFATSEISNLRNDGENVGSMVSLLAKKLGRG